MKQSKIITTLLGLAALVITGAIIAGEPWPDCPPDVDCFEQEDCYKECEADFQGCMGQSWGSGSPIASFCWSERDNCMRGCQAGYPQ